MVKSTLTRKLLRDMNKSRMQFLAVLLLCALGTWVFSGLDASWRMLQASINQYFDRQNIADFWVSVPSADRSIVARISAMNGVDDVQARASADLKADLPHEPTLAVHGYVGAMRVNLPLLRQGEALVSSDLRGCLMEEQFAQANGLTPGDRITLKLGALRYEFIIRGLCLSPEHVITSNDITSDPHNYGFLLYNSQAMPELKLNELCITLDGGADARAVASDIESVFPYALVVDHSSHSSTQRTENDVTMFQNMCYIFPLLAFAVATMIVMVTLTRMIENQRVQMGTLKALGYRDRQIERHYLNYALIPALVGSLLGLFTGRETIAYVIWDMEASNYILPWRIQAPIPWTQWAMSVLMVLLSLFICLSTYRKHAREVTASLLRPKPPKSGSRLFLERFPRIWSRFGFNAKMIMRNLFRNKARTLMGLAGVLCCTMLLVTSLGLSDSVEFFARRYYEHTITYDIRANLTSEAGELEAYQRRLSAGLIEGIMEKAVSLRSDKTTKTTMLTVISDDQQMMLLGRDETYTPVTASGVALTQKMADTMGVALGDRVSIWLPGDTEPIWTEVRQLLYVNIGQGVYMTRSVWESCAKGAFIPTALLLREPDEACLRTLADMDELDSLKEPKKQYEQTISLLQSATVAFSMMSGVALGLAFVVLYNMGILNFSERSREYATLKVLGYHQKEIRDLMNNENILLTLLGIGLGLLPGRMLTAAVMRACESENMVFAVSVSLSSYLFAGVITLAFSVLIQQLLTRKVRTIDMVEALKSVE